MIVTVFFVPPEETVAIYVPGVALAAATMLKLLILFCVKATPDPFVGLDVKETPHTFALDLTVTVALAGCPG